VPVLISYRNAAGEAKWTAVYDSISNTIGIVVDASQSMVSAMEFAQLEQYLEQWFQAQGVGWATTLTDNVADLIRKPVKRSPEAEAQDDLIRREDYCSADTLSVLHSIVAQMAQLPSDSQAC